MFNYSMLGDYSGIDAPASHAAFLALPEYDHLLTLLSGKIN
jgi:hypothetical protein